ncbi:MAG: hypothetical protein AAF585_17465 [Verrucomicrobiota bacterium]
MQPKLTLLFLSSILGIFTLSGCVYGPGFEYYGAEESIWNERGGNRYGASAPRAERYADASNATRRSSSSPYRTYTGTNRYGANSNRGRPSSRQYDPGDPPRLSAAAQRVPDETQYEREITDNPPPGGRDRMTPEPREDRLTSVPPPVAEEEPAPRSEPPASNDFSHLPFATPVPGKAGYVTMPNTPEIDVRGIAPGTPVEIPDPRNPGKTIQFRVP